MHRALLLATALLLALVVAPAGDARAAGSVTASITADTYVSSARPSNSYGRTANALVDDGVKIAYFRFTVTGIPAGVPVTDATLTLTGLGTQTTQAVDLYTVSAPWSETTTYRTRPVLGVKLGSKPIGTGTTASFTVPVPGNGTVSFAVVRTTAGGDNRLGTRESAATSRPRLTVSYGDTAPPPAACSDGRDNDADGVIDYPADPGCATASDTDEADPVVAPAPSPACSDGRDNDADGVIDYPADPGCATASDTDEADPVVAPAPSPASGPFIAYSSDSFFRKPLPDVTPVSATSADGVAYAWANDPSSYFKIRGAKGVGWGIAYAQATCSDPIYKIGATGSVPSSQAHLRTVGFHAPASVWQNIPPTSDAPFLVIDRCGTSARPAGLSVWGSGTSVVGDTVSVRAAGSFSHDSNGLDRRNPASDSILNERSRGVIPDSMAIRVDLLDAAIRNGTGLGHVLEVFWVQTDSTAGFVHPMVGAESGKAGYGAEGERLRIRAGIDLAARPGCSPTTNPVGLAIARTLQQNGAYLGDNSGSGSGIKTEQNADYPGLTADSLKGCMTWDDIEFLPRGWTG